MKKQCEEQWKTMKNTGGSDGAVGVAPPQSPANVRNDEITHFAEILHA
jgi:hypothetical protein